MSVQSFQEAIRLYVETSGDTDLAKLAARLTQLGEGADKGAAQAQALVDELAKLTDTSNSLRAFTALKASIAETATQLEAAKVKLAGLGAEFDSATAPSDKLQRAMAAAAREVTALTQTQNRQQVELARTSAALRAAGVDTDKVASEYARLQDQIGTFGHNADAAAAAMQKAGNASKGAAKGVGALDSAAKSGALSLGSIAKGLAKVSGAAAGAVSALASLAGGALFVGAVRSASDLEEALGQVRAVSGATSDEMVALKAAAEAGAAATKFSALEAAQGLGELARATGSAQSAIAALPATLSLAQAAGIGVADAATFITTTLTQFGLAATDASRVADVLAKAANSTTADVTGLGDALSYAAPLAKQLGIDTESTVAVIGALADQGFRGERAGTALRNVFGEMLNPTSAFAKSLRDLGIESSDFATVIEQLAEKGAKGRDALLNLDSAARPAILALVDSGGKGLRQLDADLRNAGGSAAATAKIMGDNVAGAAEAMRDAFDRTRRSLIEPLLEPLKTELVNLSAELVQFAQSPEFEEIKGALQELFTEGAKAAHELIANTDWHALAENIRSAIGEASTTLNDLRDNLGTVITAVELVGHTFSLVFNAVQAVVLALASVVSKLVSMFAEVADAVTGPQRALLEFLGVIDKGQGDLSEFAGGMNAVAEHFRDGFVSNVGEASDALTALVNTGSDASTSVPAALGAVAKATDGAADSAHGLADAATQAGAALDQQAKGATTAAGQTAAAAGSMVSDAERLKKAFADLGVSSQADLKSTAESAAHNFELIRAAVGEGKATTEDAKRAFVAYAQAALAASKDSDASAQSRVRSELAVRGATVGATDALVELGLAGASAGDQVGTGAAKASTALSQVADNAGSAAANIERAGDAMERAGESANAGAGGMRTMTESMVAMSQEAVNALAALNHLANNQPEWRRNVNEITGEWRRQSAALADVNKQLDDQLAAYDPLKDKLAALRLQYKYVDDATLRNIAQKQQQLEEQQKRADDATQQATQAQTALQATQREAGAAPANTGPATAVRGGAASALGAATKVIRLELPGSGLPGVPVAVNIDDEAALEALLQKLLGRLSAHRSVAIRR